MPRVEPVLSVKDGPLPNPSVQSHSGQHCQISGPWALGCDSRCALSGRGLLVVACSRLKYLCQDNCGLSKIVFERKAFLPSEPLFSQARVFAPLVLELDFGAK